jgi:F420-dependent oxidoreductase-like protein
VHTPEPVRVVDPGLYDAPRFAVVQKEDPVPLTFGLQIPRFTWEGDGAVIRSQLASMAGAAEGAGFESIWVMDHFIQIPVVGREWEPMLDSYTTLGFLAGVTERVRLGAMVTGVTYRNVAHLGKIVATLDVLSGGRAICGIGAAWFEKEHRAYGWDFPPLRERFALLEDALELLPMVWGPGSPAFKGRVIEVPEAVCYPRPLQEKVPILVGGSGEKRTLKLVAQYADACNLFGPPETVAHKVGVLHQHCADVGRDPDEITVTNLFTVRRDATVDELVGRLRQYADAGLQTAVVNIDDLQSPAQVEQLASVIDSFR